MKGVTEAEGVRPIQPGDIAIIQHRYRILDITPAGIKLRTSKPISLIPQTTPPNSSNDWKVAGDNDPHMIEFRPGMPLRVGLTDILDVDKLIASYLRPKDLLNFGLTSKQYSSFLYDEVFWGIKIQHDYPGAIEYKPFYITFKRAYKELLLNKTPKSAASNGLLYILKWMKSRSISNTISKDTFIAAIEVNRVDILEWMYETDQATIDELINPEDEDEDDYDEYDEDVRVATENATGLGYIDVLLFLFNAAPTNKRFIFIDIEYGAVSANRFDMLEWLEGIRSNEEYEYAHGSYIGNFTNTVEMLEYLHKNGYDPDPDRGWLQYSVIEEDRVDLMQWYIEHLDNEDKSAIVKMAAGHGAINILKWFRELQRHGDDFFDISKIVHFAVTYYRMNILEWVMSFPQYYFKIRTEYRPNSEVLYKYLLDATYYGQLDLLKWIASTWNAIPDSYILSLANKLGYTEINEWMFNIASVTVPRHMGDKFAFAARTLPKPASKPKPPSPTWDQ